MKRKIRILALTTVCALVLSGTSFASSSTLSSNAEDVLQHTQQYTYSEIDVNGLATPCIVKNEVSAVPSAKTEVVYATYHTTLYIPLTEEQKANTVQIISELNSGEPPAQLFSSNPHDMDPWYECEYHIETNVEYETRHNVQVATGEHKTVTYARITNVRYGYYTYIYGEGKVSLRDPQLRVYQVGYTGDIPTSDLFCFNEKVAGEGDNFHCAGLDSLLTWTPPSDWPKVALETSSWIGAVLSGTAVNNYGDTYQVEISSIAWVGY